jgi:hypothetical protein
MAEMPEGEPAESLRLELAAAAELLQTQRDLETALKVGEAPEAMHVRIRRQEEAIRALREATLRRRAWLDGRGSLAAFVDRHPEQALELDRLASEAVVLRREIRRSALRAEYVARKVVDWTEAQFRAVLRVLDGCGPTYRQPGAEPPRRGHAGFVERAA